MEVAKEGQKVTKRKKKCQRVPGQVIRDQGWQEAWVRKLLKDNFKQNLDFLLHSLNILFRSSVPKGVGLKTIKVQIEQVQQNYY